MGRVGLCKYVVSVCVLGGERMLLDSERWLFSCPLLGLLTRRITGNCVHRVPTLRLGDHALSR